MFDLYMILLLSIIILGFHILSKDIHKLLNSQTSELTEIRQILKEISSKIS